MKKIKSVIYLLFAAYALLMLWLLFGQRLPAYPGGVWTENYWADFMRKINLIPFSTVAEFWNALSGTSRTHAVINLAGNVIMFVPLGFLLPCAFPRAGTFRGSMLWALIIIVCVEILQLVTLLGSLDVDDVILNMLGAAMGFAVYRILCRRKA